MPVGAVLVFAANGDELVFGEGRANDLERDRESIGKAAGQGKRRESG